MIYSAPPEHLTAAHDVAAFDCGVPELDNWLKERAFPNEASRASRTFVVVSEGRVVGYYDSPPALWCTQPQQERFDATCQNPSR